MSVQDVNCPSCGAPLRIENRFSKIVICQYCGQTSHVTPAGLDPTGEKVLLADFPSVLSVGAEGKLAGTPFRVLGRLRYKYDEGFWDEWFVLLDGGRRVWLHEDEGVFVSFEKQTLTSEVPGYAEVAVGKNITVNGMNVFVVEKNQALIAGGEGELSFSIEPGERVDYVDGNSAGKIVSLEYAPDEINLSIGSEIPLSDIVLNPA